MRNKLSAGLVAIGLVLSSAAMAQTNARTTDGARGEGAERTRMSAADRDALLDARIAALKTGLKLNAEQEKSWPPVEAAMRDLAKERRARMAERRESRKSGEREDAIERLRRTSENLSERATGLKRLADASEPLYRSLDDGQKRRLQVLTRQAMQPAHGMRRRH